MTIFTEEIVPESTDRTDDDRMAEAIGIDTDIRYCACGCGEKLKPTAKQEYIRGHKLAKAAGTTTRDPDPPINQEKRMPTFTPETIPSSVKQDLEDKLNFFLEIIAMGWESRDPLCGGEFEKRTKKISEKLVPIIARNPELMRWFTTSGNISVWLDLFMVLLPIGKMVAQHHILHSVEIQEPEGAEVVDQLPNSFYPVP